MKAMTESERKSWADAYHAFEYWNGMDNTEENWSKMGAVFNKMYESTRTEDNKDGDMTLFYLLGAIMNIIDYQCGGKICASLFQKMK